MGDPYRAPQNLPKPPPDPMRTVLVVTGAIAAIGAAVHTELVPMTNPSVVVAAHDVFGFSMYGGIVHRSR